MNRAVRTMVSWERVGVSVMVKVVESVSVTEEGGEGSCTAELNVPKSSSTEVLGVCLFILDDGAGFEGGLYIGGEEYG